MIDPGTLFFLCWVIVIIGVVLVTARRRVKALKAAAQDAGLTAIRADLFGRVISSWRGYVVTWGMAGGGRDGPERAVVEIAVSTWVRITVRRRIKFDLDVSLFGPPVVQTAFDGDFVVRSDDAMLAERVLGDAKIMGQPRPDILERWDRLEIVRRRVRATRVNGPMTRDQTLRAAWKLASTVVEQLELPPA